MTCNNIKFFFVSLINPRCWQGGRMRKKLNTFKVIFRLNEKLIRQKSIILFHCFNTFLLSSFWAKEKWKSCNEDGLLSRNFILIQYHTLNKQRLVWHMKLWNVIISSKLLRFIVWCEHMWIVTSRIYVQTATLFDKKCFTKQTCMQTNHIWNSLSTGCGTFLIN